MRGLKALAMLVLALDTSMAACSACLYDSAGQRFLAHDRQEMERGHAEALPLMVEALMKDSGTLFSALARIAVTTGPGSFTGLRVGLSFANGLGQALGIPVIGIDTLTATHLGVPSPEPRQFVVHKAGNSEFYYFSYNDHSTNIEMLKLEALLETLPPQSLSILGTGADDVMALRPDASRIKGHDLPDARSFAGWASLQPDPETFPQPLYIRGADAKPQLNSPPVSVIRAGRASLSRLSTIHQKAFAKSWSEEELDGLLALPGTVALLAQDKAFILYRIAADEAEILTLATEPAARQKGLATALVKAAATRLRAEGAKSFFLEVATDNHPAQALYRKLGFKQAGRRRSYYDRQEGPAIDADILRLSLI